MKRNIIYAAFAATLLLLAAASCTKDNLHTHDGCYISINISSKAPETKGQPGSDLYNENIVNDVYYFFYKEGETAAAPVVKGSLKGLEFKGGARTEEIPVASGTGAALFGSSDKCQAFLVANPPQSLKSLLEDSPTLTELRTALFQSSLDSIQDSFTMIFDDAATKEASVGNIMTVEAKLKRLANKVTVSLLISKEVHLPAEWTSVPEDARVEFHNAFKETALGGDFAAVRSRDSNFKEKFFNSSAIGFGAPEESGSGKWSCGIVRPIYSYAADWDFVQNIEPYLLIELPWKETSTGDIKATYYKVFFSAKEFSINNWHHLTVDIDRLGGFQKEDPVSVLEPLEYQVLDWNSAYEDGQGLTTDIDAARYLMMDQTEFFLYNQDDWNFPYTSSHECEIVMEGPEDETYERMNYRKRDAEPVRGKSREMGLDKDGNPIYDCTLNGSLITFHHKLNNDFTDKEEIDGIKYGAYDVVPYTFKLTIRHKDNHDYKQEVIVHQYPAIYIEAQPNSAGVLLVKGSGVVPTAFVNINSEILDDKVDSERSGLVEPNHYVLYQYSGYGGDPQDVLKESLGNSNGNMYVITTTTAPNQTVNDKPYMLADPRQYSVQNLSSHPADPMPDEHTYYEQTDYTYEILHYEIPYTGNIFVDAAHQVQLLYGKQDRSSLAYYLPTRSSSDAENIIAPKLRVASSYGQCKPMCYERAVRRCAAYQEDGYPAGRWRLPTAAEVMYICKLSADHMIPMLFGQYSTDTRHTYSYWCSTGQVAVYNSEISDGTFIDTYAPPIYTAGPENATERSAVRCVYDEWYWENRDYDNGTVATEKGRLPQSLWRTRYWGDMPR